MLTIFKTIYYLYDTYVYKGTLKKLHGDGFSKEHALGVFAFLQAINIMSLINFLKLDKFGDLPVWGVMFSAIVLYLINRYFLIGKKLDGTPSRLMISVTLLYVLVSAILFCVSEWRM